jgi:hypothetical protein
MKNKTFQELLKSVKEGGKILCREIKPARTYTIVEAYKISRKLNSEG